MNYQPKVVRCRLHTGGKTIQEIRERYAGQGMTYRDFESIQRANEEFDGLVVLLSLWDYDNHEAYHLHNWDPADDERMMMAIYHSEQVHPFPRYKNALEQFKADWAAGTYDPGATLCFQPEDVEEIEVLCEEIVPEPQTATPPPGHPKRSARSGEGSEVAEMCDKSCPDFGKCEKCRHGKKTGKRIECRIGDRRGPHSRCFTCRKEDRCKRARKGGEPV